MVTSSELWARVDLRVWSADWSQGWPVTDFVALDATRSRHVVDEATFKVANDHPALSLLRGDRVKVRIDLDGNHFFSGEVESHEIDLEPGGLASFSCRSHWLKLMTTLGYPSPSTALSTSVASGPQTQSKMWWKAVGSTEYAVKTIVQENLINREGMPIAMQTNESRGLAGTVVTSRMHPILERTQTAMDASGLVFTLEQTQDTAPQLTFGCRWANNYTVPLDELGVVQGGKVKWEAPSMTAAVVGGRGLGDTRLFYKVAGGVHSTWHREGFVDAKDIVPNDETTVAQANQQTWDKGAEALQDTGPKTSIEFELVETESFGWRNPIEVGDRVTINAAGVPVNDVLEQIKLTVNASDGIKLTPSVGGVQATPSAQIAHAVQRAHAGIRDLRRS